MHNGMLELGSEKMAKSVGNIRGLSEVLDDVGPEVVLLFMSTGHYRQPLAFSDEALESAKASVARIREAGRRLIAGPSPDSLASYRDGFFAALRNDFNTAEALASLYGWIREANRSEEAVGNAHLVEMLSRARAGDAGGRRGGRATRGRRPGRGARRRARGEGLG